MMWEIIFALLTLIVCDAQPTSAGHLCAIGRGNEPNIVDSSCESFYVCKHFKGKLAHCPKGQQFSYPALRCKPGAKVWCNHQRQHYRLLIECVSEKANTKLGHPATEKPPPTKEIKKEKSPPKNTTTSESGNSNDSDGNTITDPLLLLLLAQFLSTPVGAAVAPFLGGILGNAAPGGPNGGGGGLFNNLPANFPGLDGGGGPLFPLFNRPAAQPAFNDDNDDDGQGGPNGGQFGPRLDYGGIGGPALQPGVGVGNGGPLQPGGGIAGVGGPVQPGGGIAGVPGGLPQPGVGVGLGGPLHPLGGNGGFEIQPVGGNGNGLVNNGLGQNGGVNGLFGVGGGPQGGVNTPLGLLRDQAQKERDGKAGVDLRRKSNDDYLINDDRNRKDEYRPVVFPLPFPDGPLDNQQEESPFSVFHKWLDGLEYGFTIVTSFLDDFSSPIADSSKITS